MQNRRLSSVWKNVFLSIQIVCRTKSIWTSPPPPPPLLNKSGDWRWFKMLLFGINIVKAIEKACPPATSQMYLRKCSVSPDPPLFGHIKYEEKKSEQSQTSYYPHPLYAAVHVHVPYWNTWSSMWYEHQREKNWFWFIRTTKVQTSLITP